jgi:outer membrane murein-binding lipoprotein Lpp
MAEPAPHVDAPRAVEDDTPSITAESEPQEPTRSRSGLLVAAVALLGLFAGFLAWQTAQLQSENTALSAQVTTLQEQVRAYETTVEGARERAAGLRTQLDDLEAWLSQN